MSADLWFVEWSTDASQPSHREGPMTLAEARQRRAPKGVAFIILQRGNGEEIMGDTVNHPSHYNDSPSGVECIDVVEHMTFNIGNAVKYLWRAGLKGNAIEDMQKAIWYINREIQRFQRASKSPSDTKAMVE